MKRKLSKTSTTTCPFCGKKNYYYGNTLKKCKHLNAVSVDKGAHIGCYVWIFDKAGRGFKPTFTIKHASNPEDKNTRSKYQMSKFVR